MRGQRLIRWIRGDCLCVWGDGQRLADRGSTSTQTVDSTNDRAIKCATRLPRTGIADEIASRPIDIVRRSCDERAESCRFDLRLALLANSAFSGISGAAMTLGHQPLAQLMGIEPPLLLAAIGTGLLIFAASVFHNSRREVVSRLEALATIIGDLAWGRR